MFPDVFVCNFRVVMFMRIALSTNLKAVPMEVHGGAVRVLDACPRLPALLSGIHADNSRELNLLPWGNGGVSPGAEHPDAGRIDVSPQRAITRPLHLWQMLGYFCGETSLLRKSIA